jgi:uncharacterized protein
MRVVTEFPRKIVEIENLFIPLKDGTKLAARIWLPADAEKDPVPAILEYLPYRKRDGTIERDATTHPYFAGHGYAAIRVDIRGSGDSAGILRGEYLKQEQDDALEILDWLGRQSWCTGAVGMIGISWGGFNGLQVAARRHPALKAVISICSTDDRYADDIHFMGGALLIDKISWYSTMFSLNTTPPDPLIVGENWRRMWLERIEKSGFWLEEWLSHQRRDAFYKQGSVSEDWGAIQCPVYAVGGWADGYSNAVFRLLANLKGPKKGLIGPWAHKYPHFARPGPQIGFLQECLRWWDQWLKGKNTGIMDEPVFRVWMEDPAPPQPDYDTRPGRWVAEPSWPSPNIGKARHPLLDGALGAAGGAAGSSKRRLHPLQTVGLTAGKWCPYGYNSDQSRDQRGEEGGQLLFDSVPLAEDVETLGFPELELAIASDRPEALLAATLCEIMPDGAVTRISYGILNLSHRDGHEKLQALEPGRFYRIRLTFNGMAHRFAKGNRIRVALSTAYWPIVWPSPSAATLDFDLSGCALVLPTRPRSGADAALRPFLEAEGSPHEDQTHVEPCGNARSVDYDFNSGVTTVRRTDNDGVRRIGRLGLDVGYWRDNVYSIKENDPLSAKIDIASRRLYRRGDWRIGSETRIVMTATETDFLVSAVLDAYEGDTRIVAKTWSLKIPRDHV